MFKFLLFALTFAISCMQAAESAPTAASRYVLVSVAPYKFFLNRVAGDTVKVGLLVPAAASSHTYEPTPKQILEASSADLWFTIGESFECRILPALQARNPNLQAVDLRQGLDLIAAASTNSCSHGCCKGSGGEDLHIWLSLRQVEIQVRTIAAALSARYPENAQLYAHNAEQFIAELHTLDQQISTLLAPLKQRTILVSHPAYAYFCRDYNLEQLSIEFEGKDPSPQQLTKLLQQAKQKKIKAIFIQRQYSNKGAKLIATQLGAKLVMLDPYSENYLSAMREIAENFANQ